MRTTAMALIDIPRLAYPVRRPLDLFTRPEPAFAATGLFMLALMAPTLFAAFVDGRSFNGVNVWAKPLKFEFSLAVWFLTLAFFARWLPEGLRERIKGRIRAASGAYVGAAFGSGLIVSLLELACTGQVYLPTISFMVSVPQMRGSAIGYLLLYNAAFIVPLVVVLLLAVYGVSAAHVQDWFVRNAARTKLLMAVLFAGLAGLLATQVVAL